MIFLLLCGALRFVSSFKTYSYLKGFVLSSARREMLIASEHVSSLIGLLPSHIAVVTRFNVQDLTAGRLKTKVLWATSYSNLP